MVGMSAVAEHTDWHQIDLEKFKQQININQENNQRSNKNFKISR